MKKYILAAMFSLALLASPAFTQASSLTSSQINAIVSLLQSFGADQTIINNVQASLNGGTPTGGGTGAWCHTFNRDLTVGSSGEDVEALTRALSLSGITSDDHTTTFAEDTAADVVQFQAKYGIRQTGYVGPITRAKLNALYGCVLPPIPPPLPPLPPTISYVQSKVAETNVIYVGEEARIFGKGFSPNTSVTVFVDDFYSSTGVSASGQTNVDGTQITFIVPNVPAGNYSLYVKDPNALGSNSIKITVKVPGIVTPSITVLSPNGGEQWQKGSTQNITWNPAGAGMIDIRLVSYYPPCTGTVCTMYYPVPAEYMIATQTANDGVFEWGVGKSLDGKEIPEGKYTIRVSRSIGAYEARDESNAPFSIVASDNTTAPYITSAWSDLAGNATMKGGRFGNAGSNVATMIRLNEQVINSGANTNNGYYIVNYVDGVGYINFRPADFGITTSGSYPVQIINPSTGNSNSVTLNYTAPTITTSSITVLSPNGGEQWQKGSTQNITWNPAGAGMIDISLVSYRPPCTGIGISCTALYSVEYAIATQTANDGVFEWGVGKSLDGKEIPEGKYTIRVSRSIGAYEARDESDAPFSIVAGTTTTTQSIAIYRSPATSPTNPYKVGDATVSSSVNSPSFFSTDHTGTGYNQIGSNTPRTFTFSTKQLVDSGACNAATGTCNIPGNWSATDFVCPAGVTGVQQMTEWYTIGNTSSNKLTWYFQCSTTTPTSSYTPVGSLDGTDNGGTASGWAVDPDSPTTSISVHFYIDGAAGQGGTYAGSAVANLANSTANSAGYPGSHGYSFSIPQQWRDGKPHTLYAHGIDLSGDGSKNILLSNVPKSFTLGTVTAPTPALTVSPTTFAAGASATITVANAAPNATVKVFCRDPNGAVCDDPVSYTTNSSGQFSHTYNTTGWTLGTYRGWVTVNGVQSNTVTFTVTAPVQTITISRTPGTSLASPFKVGDATVSSSVNTPSLFASNLTGTGYNQIGTNAPRTFTFTTFDLVNSGACNATTGICNIPGNWDAASFACPAGLGTGTTQYMTEWYTIGNVTSNKLNWYFKCSGSVLGANTFSYTWNRDLQIGSPYQGDVIALQQALTREGVYAGEITGGFYNQTYAAVKSFQQKYGIEATGFVGPLTRAELNTLFAR